MNNSGDKNQITFKFLYSLTEIYNRQGGLKLMANSLDSGLRVLLQEI